MTADPTEKANDVERNIVLLENFAAPASVIRLEDGLRIAVLDDSDLGLMLEGAAVAAMHWETDVFWGVIQERPYGPTTNPDEFWTTIMVPLLTFLRLMRSEVVGCRYWVTKRRHTTLSRHDMIAPSFRTTVYRLEPGQIEQLIADWPKVKGCPAFRQNPLAFRRFDGMYQAKLEEDVLIDAWVALESLFMSDANPQEATFRLSLRMAYFLSSDGNERLEIDTAFRKSYKVRSDLIHGRTTNETDFAHALDAAVDALRSTFIRLIFDAEQIDLKEIDRAIRIGTRPGDALASEGHPDD